MSVKFVKMSENQGATSEPPQDNSNTTDEKQVDITRYFNNAPHTIFDEIVAPNKPSFFDVPDAPIKKIAEFDSSLSGTSNDFLGVNSLIENDQALEHTVSNDVHRDTWIPSEHTRKVLRSIATSTAGTTFLDKENLTMPGLALQGDMPDLIKNASIHFLGEDENIHRNVLTASDVTQDERGLRNLIQAGCYRAAINLSGRLLAIYAQGYGKINQPSKHTPHSLQLWLTRLSLLTKLRQVDVLENESKPFGNLDKPDMYFTYYPELYGTRPGSMASFSFRLLLAEIPFYCGKAKQALDNLHKILATVNQIISNYEAGLSGEGTQTKMTPTEREDAIRLWKARRSRVFISIVNCTIGMKNYILVIDVLENLCKSSDWSEDQLEILQSAIGRVHLLLGDVSAAEKNLLHYKEKQGTVATARDLINRGLMAVAQNTFQEAFNCFQTASTMDPSNIMLINNMAVCLLYTGQLKAAVHLYESAVARNPVKSLQEPILLNMCTSYELHTTHCKQTKLHLLRQLNRYKGDAVDVQCLKLSM